MRPSLDLKCILTILLITGSIFYSNDASSKPQNYLSCKIFFDDQAYGYIKYQKEPGGGEIFVASVTVSFGPDGRAPELPLPVPVPPAPPPMFEAGDKLPVLIFADPARGPAWRYKAGTIVLKKSVDPSGKTTLAGRIIYQRKKGFSTFPPNFAPLGPGIKVSIDDQRCSLKERMTLVPPERG